MNKIDSIKPVCYNIAFCIINRVAIFDAFFIYNFKFNCAFITIIHLSSSIKNNVHSQRTDPNICKNKATIYGLR